MIGLKLSAKTHHSVDVWTSPDVLVCNLFEKHFHRCHACKILHSIEKKTRHSGWFCIKQCRGGKNSEHYSDQVFWCLDKQLVKSLIWERSLTFPIWQAAGATVYTAFWLLKCSIESWRLILTRCAFLRGPVKCWSVWQACDWYY